MGCGGGESDWAGGDDRRWDGERVSKLSTNVEPRAFFRLTRASMLAVWPMHETRFLHYVPRAPPTHPRFCTKGHPPRQSPYRSSSSLTSHHPLPSPHVCMPHLSPLFPLPHPLSVDRERSPSQRPPLPGSCDVPDLSVRPLSTSATEGESGIRLSSSVNPLASLHCLTAPPLLSSGIVTPPVSPSLTAPCVEVRCSPDLLRGSVEFKNRALTSSRPPFALSVCPLRCSTSQPDCSPFPH